MQTIRRLCLALVVIGVTGGAACAGDTLKFKTKLSPGILTKSGDLTAALDFDLGVSTELWSRPTAEAFRKNLTAHVATRGSLAIDPDLNTHPLVADVGVTTSMSLYRPSKVEPGNSPGEYRTTEQGFNCGLVSLGLLGGYETDQRLANRNITAGAELGYVLTENKGLKALVPSLFVGYEYVFVDEMTLRNIRGINESDHLRFRVFSSWKLPVGRMLPSPLEPLNAHLDLRYYLSDGVRHVLHDDTLYVAGALSYSFGEKPLLGIVNAVFVRVADGRIPPATVDARTVTLGLTVWER